MKVDFKGLELKYNDLKNIREHYHMDNVPLTQLEAIYNMVFMTLKPDIYYQIETTDVLGVNMNRYAICVASLGEGIDKLHDVYSGEGELLMAYIIDVLGMELLLKLYSLIGVNVALESGFYITDYIFLGADIYPMSLCDDIFKILKIKDIKYNEAYAFTPRKTVAYIGKISKDKVKNQCISICENCHNNNCVNRKINKKSKIGSMSYGYRVIFGNEGK